MVTLPPLLTITAGMAMKPFGPESAGRDPFCQDPLFALLSCCAVFSGTPSWDVELREEQKGSATKGARLCWSREVQNEVSQKQVRKV